MQVFEIIDVGHDSSGMRIVLQIEEDSVYLIEFTFRIDGFLSKLVAVGLTDASVFIGPGIPYVGMKVMDVVALFLPDPKYLIKTALEGSLSYGENRQFLLKIITVDDAEFLDGMCRCPVFPVWSYGIIGIPDSVVQDVIHVVDEYLICYGHVGSS